MTRNCKPSVGARSPRNRGAQPGNQNARRHGRRSAAAVTAAKLSTARIKALSYIIWSSGLADWAGRYRISPLRPDQIALLQQLDPELLRFASQCVPSSEGPARSIVGAP